MLSERGIEVKRQLEDLNQHKRRIRNLRSELQELLELGTIPNRTDYKLPSGKGGTASSPQERYLIRVEDLQEKISRAIDGALQTEDRFLEGIDNLDVLSQNLLMERYLTGKPLKRIIREFNYSRAQIFRLYDISFEKVATNIKDETK